MPLVDRANNILALLLSEERLKQGDISFVVHSFGGLIFEQLLRTASDRSATQETRPISSSALAVSPFWALRILEPIGDLGGQAATTRSSVSCHTGISPE